MRILIPLAVAAVAAFAGPAAAQRQFGDERAFDRAHAAKFKVGLSVSGVLRNAMVVDEGKMGMNGWTAAPTVKEPVCGCDMKADGTLSDPTRCEALRGVADEDMAVVAPLPLINFENVVSRLACFQRGLPACMRGGVTVGGMSCCSTHDDGARAVFNDPTFYSIAPKPLVDRLAGLVPGNAAPGSPVMCGIAIDKEAGVFSTPRSMDGMMARMMIYASERYGAFTGATPDVLSRIELANPPGRFEILRERASRLRFRAQSAVMTKYLRANPPSEGMRSLGATE